MDVSNLNKKNMAQPSKPASIARSGSNPAVPAAAMKAAATTTIEAVTLFMAAGYKVCAVSTYFRNGRLRFTVVDNLSTNELAKAVCRRVSDNVDLIITDEWAAYVNAIGPYYDGKLRRIKHRQTYVRGDIYTNNIENAFSLLKRGIVGSWHHVSVKHLQRYLDEVAFRFSERKNPRLFSDTLSELLSADPITFKKLTEERAA